LNKHVFFRLRACERPEKKRAYPKLAFFNNSSSQGIDFWPDDKEFIKSSNKENTKIVIYLSDILEAIEETQKKLEKELNNVGKTTLMQPLVPKLVVKQSGKLKESCRVLSDYLPKNPETEAF
jgi:hypothetical protein